LTTTASAACAGAFAVMSAAMARHVPRVNWLMRFTGSPLLEDVSQNGNKINNQRVLSPT